MSHESARELVDLIEPCINRWLGVAERRTLVVGICGAQGSGKSTVSAGVAARLTAKGRRVAVLSIDDLYLPRAAREQLGAIHPLLRTRGVPGTHDVQLGLDVIDACARLGSITLPRFDKATDDRIPRSGPTIEGPLDVLLFEGWCVGAVAQSPEALDEPVNGLERDEDGDGTWRRYVNRQLAEDYQRLFARVDHLILLEAPEFACVRTWRGEQEVALRTTLSRQGCSLGATLDDAALDRFIQHYERLTRHILAEMPSRADLRVSLDAQRQPVSVQGAN